MALAMSAVRTWVGTGAAARAAAFASARPLFGDDASSAQQPVNETPEALGLASCNPPRGADPGTKQALDRLPDPGVDKFFTQGIGHDPVSPGGVLGQ